MIQENISKFNKRNIIVWFLLFVLLSTFLLYTYFLNATILHIVERKSAEQNIADTTMHISELEVQYMALSAGITPELADGLGFVDPGHIIFVQRGVHVGLATLGE